MAELLNRVLRVGEGRKLKELTAVARATNAFEEETAALDDAGLKARYAELREEVEGRLEDGEELGGVLRDVEPETFALVREAARRSMGMRHFDVQLMGGGALHRGWIAEMRTGEGKTLVATLPVALNALTGRGVHLVTVNDYLARRDAAWMAPVYELLGITVGVIQSSMPSDERRRAYACDVTYGTNSEFGFDYLRDNLAVELEHTVQRGHPFAIVDEVDSILIDEARTPLIISGQPEEAPATYYEFARIAKRLTIPDDYEIDEKRKTVAPTEQGVHKVEKALGVENLYAPGNGQLVNHLVQSLKAESLYKRDIEYVVIDGQVKIVDEFTGRIMEGRRWSEGLHQAVEAKEGVKIEAENITVATVTIQNYFRLYDKLAGMTGTAATEANEFAEIYKLEVTSIPTNVPMMRRDENDLIYKTKPEKFAAVVEDIAGRHEAGQPVLVGTVNIETSEHLSGLLERRGVPHNVLNAKQHEREAEIVKDAGRPGAVTIATNMAGRGVDIKLGDGVPERGGLYVLGTERHESRRIDNQLRGRSGRQGDPGESRFYLSAEDEVVRLFAGDRIYKILDRLGPPEGEPIEHRLLTRQIEGAQKRVEEQNFEIRKNVLKYDDVLNKQRQVVYEERRRVLEGQDISELVSDWIDETVERVVESHTESQFPEEWDLEGMLVGLRAVYPTQLTLEELGGEGVDLEDLMDRVAADAQDAYARKEAELVGLADRFPDFPRDMMRRAERFYLLQTIDAHWREHLDNMDYLREGIHLRGLAQKDPLVEYRSEGHAMFQEMMRAVEEEVVTNLFHFVVEIEAPGDGEAAAEAFETHDDDAGLQPAHESVNILETDPARRPAPAGAAPARRATGTATRASTWTAAASGGSSTSTVEQRHVEAEVGRNEPCPCGSGKKYKRCHGS
ncbi:MAG: Protein translocase subunit SecA [uncultured Thermoleophilia bacterium]|uniref:Protein translocase subunit SecA n=1 Tax=uncultured Thermoleophilia bacterium TaxID=1497501 RepID=A0A6J4UJT6_9ACTN|nr:MAG: Protein translocase subunit SecA [uncultured Thermoleophilia bacterium]